VVGELRHGPYQGGVGRVGGGGEHDLDTHAMRRRNKRLIQPVTKCGNYEQTIPCVRIKMDNHEPGPWP
jgi:hypothetical protein